MFGFVITDADDKLPAVFDRFYLTDTLDSTEPAEGIRFASRYFHQCRIAENHICRDVLLIGNFLPQLTECFEKAVSGRKDRSVTMTKIYMYT